MAPTGYVVVSVSRSEGAPVRSNLTLNDILGTLGIVSQSSKTIYAEGGKRGYEKGPSRNPGRKQTKLRETIF